MARLRIAVVTPELPNREYPNRGRSVYQTLLCLRDYSELQAFCPLPRYPAGFHPRFDYRHSDLSFSLPGLAASYFEYPAFPLITRPFNGFTCAHYLEPYLREFQADVILNFWLYPAGFAALSVGRKLRVPVVVGSIGSDLNNIPDLFSNWLTRRTLSGASKIIAKSEQLRARVLQLGGDPRKIHVVANGCDSDLFCMRDRNSARRGLNIPAGEELVVFVGRLNRGKGTRELLAAVTNLFSKRPDLRLVYVGDGPELAPLQEKVRTNNLTDRVAFAGACSAAEVAQWLAASNLMALPSHTEGCPNVVLEALSCGRPVVATNVGAVPELVDRSCGVLVPLGSIPALARAIDEALSSTWNEAAIAQRFRRSWQQVAQELFAVCEASLDAQASLVCN